MKKETYKKAWIAFATMGAVGILILLILAIFSDFTWKRFMIVSLSIAGVILLPQLIYRLIQRQSEEKTQKRKRKKQNINKLQEFAKRKFQLKFKTDKDFITETGNVIDEILSYEGGKSTTPVFTVYYEDLYRPNLILAGIMNLENFAISIAQGRRSQKEGFMNLKVPEIRNRMVSEPSQEKVRKTIEHDDFGVPRKTLEIRTRTGQDEKSDEGGRRL